MPAAVGFLFFALAIPLTGEIIDRVAVSIGSSVITESEILRQIRLTAFLNGEKPDTSPANKRRAADMLVEQALVRREIASAPGAQQADKAEIAPELLALVQRRYPKGEAYQRALTEYGLRAEDLTRQLEWQTRLLRFIDERFRPGVQLPESEMREYYENVFLPDWRGRNQTAPPSFDDVRPQIENDLLSERANSALDRWLGQTRTQTRIRYHPEAFQ
jgi:hypothetical protein